MPRARRYSPPNSVHHVTNRGNDKRCLFDSPTEFSEFLDLVAWAKSFYPVRVVGYCLMPNHWHFMLWPEEARAMSAFLHRLCTSHAIRRRKATRSVGHGHVYQDRYHAFLIDSETYYFRALRYVEANPVRAGLVSSANQWHWSSFRERLGEGRGILDPGPLELPARWPEFVGEALSQAELDDIHNKLHRHAETAPRRRRIAQ